MKRVIVTGASSMMGSAFVRECIKNQVEVLCIVRRHSGNSQRVPNSPLVKSIECNLDELHTLQPLHATPYDALYHFGWSNTAREYRNDVYRQQENIQFTLDSVHLCKRFGCSAFIGVGSQAEYGLVAEKISPKMAAHPETAYGAAKYSAGMLAEILCRQLSIRFVWTRIFSSYGKYDNETTMLMYAMKELLARRSPVLTKCEQSWDYIHCDDAAHAFYLLGDKGKDGSVYNIAGGKARLLSEYVYALRDCIDASLPIGFGERAYAEREVMYLCADIDNLVEDTGFKPQIPFEEGIAQTVKWFREERL